MTTLLQLRDVTTAYGSIQALFGISLDVAPRQVVTLLGRNGMGKSTIVKTICGMMPSFSGSVRFMDREVLGLPSYKIARMGLGLVPEGRRIFPNLTVRENLVATMGLRSGAPAESRWSVDEVFDLFPRLAERIGNGGNQLSGGEQQMLAIGRALLTNPVLLIFDEATEGLAPLVRAEIWSCIEKVKSRGQAILLIDKNIEHLMRLGDQHYVIEKGHVAWSGTTAGLRAAPHILSEHLSV
ncbi:ABC transporter ATP-binding protein [Skermanella stibiiresistens SB22]|uniref:ABC transporter ATP-binding protein n=1 Tax=Skermanella stibiiresistens SB22 TaxID=1385369 RepID=W9GUC9_9PROT|nr:ABC transporter ATP-binding protein [Skermanella stibiiresistens]EWY36256.1 ABC transporter ATP-binding protein [Skermanella stibiiresistens SB22]